jgi:hypothetical protein
MKQPEYSPLEALERIKLMMKYDMSKTLNENKEVISEQNVASTVAGTAAGAGIGAAVGAALPTSVAIPGAVGTGAASGLVYGLAPYVGGSLATAGAVVGGAAALAVLPLVYWLVTKDTGANKVKKMFEMCSSEGAKIAKLPRKMDDATFRDMSDNIDDAINDTTFGIIGGTDEEKLFAQFQRLQDGTASDFCAFVKYYNSHSDSGDLFDDLDSDIDAESEWKQIYRPIRNCVEDSLLTIKEEDPKVTGGTKTKKYKVCSGTYTQGCYSEAIKQVQGCLGGLVTDGKFGPKTNEKLKNAGFSSGFSDNDVEKICDKKDTVNNTGYEDYTTDEIETSVESASSAPANNAASVQQGKKSFIGPPNDDAVEQ